MSTISLSLPVVNRWSPPAIDQGRLEALQWLAFACMLVDHAGAFFYQNPVWMRSIGRLAFPLFALIFVWRLADMLKRNVQRGLLPMGQRLIVSGLWAQGFLWLMTDGLKEVNIMFGFTLVLALVALSEQSRPWSGLSWPLRLALAGALLGLAAPHIDYGSPGIFLMLGLYAYFRWHAVEGLLVAIGCLVLLSVFNPLHNPWAIMSIPAAVFWVGLRTPWLRMSKPIPHLFYWLYPLQFLAILVILTRTAMAAMK